MSKTTVEPYMAREWRIAAEQEPLRKIPDADLLHVEQAILDDLLHLDAGSVALLAVRREILRRAVMHISIPSTRAAASA
jgi:hypothetical protein